MKEYIQYLEDSISRLRSEQQQLEEGSRNDEAVFVRIRINIYEIARTVFDALGRATTEDFAENYAGRLAGLRRTWQENERLAREHDDVKTAVIEGIKIEAITEIEAVFEQKKGE